MTLIVSFDKNWIKIDNKRVTASNPGLKSVVDIMGFGYRPTQQAPEFPDLDLAEYYAGKFDGQIRELSPITVKGGPGSGNFQHAGRAGKVGGSAPRHPAGSIPTFPQFLGSKLDEMKQRPYIQSAEQAGFKVYRDYADIPPVQEGFSRIYHGTGSRNFASIHKLGLINQADLIKQGIIKGDPENATPWVLFTTKAQGTDEERRYHGDGIVITDIPNDMMPKGTGSELAFKKIEPQYLTGVYIPRIKLPESGVYPSMFELPEGDWGALNKYLADQRNEYEQKHGIAQKGGPGSGNFGHAGRRGKRGGSMPQGSGLGGPDHDLAKARLIDGYKRRAIALSNKFKSDLMADPEFAQDHERIKSTRAEYVRAAKAYYEFEQEEGNKNAKYEALYNESRVLERDYLETVPDQEASTQRVYDLNYKYRCQIGESHDPKYPTDPEGAVRTKALLDKEEERLKKIKLLADARHTLWYDKMMEVEKYRKEVFTQSTNLVETKLHKEAMDAAIAYGVAGQVEGVRCLEKAMKAAESVRANLYQDKVSGSLQKLMDRVEAERNTVFPELEATTDELNRLRKEPHITDPAAFTALYNKQQELNKRVGELGRITKSVWEAQDAAKEVLYDPDGDGTLSAVFKQEDFSTTRGIEDGIHEFNRLVGGNPTLDIKPAFINPLDAGVNRAYASGNSAFLAKAPTSTTTVHELGHILEGRDPMISNLAVHFLKKRIGNETPQKLKDLKPGSNFDDWEVAVKDHFQDAYMGKVYEDFDYTEIVSMGLQNMMVTSFRENFSKKDPEYFNFMYSVLRLGGI